MGCFQGISVVELDQLIYYSRDETEVKKIKKSETFDKLTHEIDVFISRVGTCLLY